MHDAIVKVKEDQSKHFTTAGGRHAQSPPYQHEGNWLVQSMRIALAKISQGLGSWYVGEAFPSWEKLPVFGSKLSFIFRY